MTNLNSSKILILGGSHSEIPLITAAKQLGLQVFTSGNQKDHPGHLVSDLYIPGDFSNLEEMQEVLEFSKCRNIVSAANDYSYLTSCILAKNNNLSGFDPPEIAFILHHKHLFKPLAKQLGIPTTKFITVNTDQPIDFLNIDLKYPLMVKPTDLTGGKGISKVDKPEDLILAIEFAINLSKQKNLILEEFFEGSLHSFSTIICDGKIIFSYTDNELCYPNPFLVSTSTSHSIVPDYILKDIFHQTENLARYLHLQNGVLHAQFLYSNDDYKILEYTRRCSGDLYSSVVQMVTGLNHAEQFIRQSLGLPTKLSWLSTAGRYVSRHCVFASAPGIVNQFFIDSDIKPYVKSITPAWPSTHIFKNSNSEKAAVVILNYKNLNEMEYFTKNIHNSIRTVI